MKLSYWGYRFADVLARAVPEAGLPLVERGAARVAPRLMPARAQQVERNLARIYGRDLSDAARREAVRETFASYVHYWSESFRLPGTSPEVLDRNISVDGMGHIEEALGAGTGAILALPHLGGWEWAAFWLTRVRGLPVSAVVEAVEPPELASWFVDLRRSFGMEVITLGAKAGAESLRALRENRILCLLCDRDIDGNGLAAPFFGEATTLPAGPATLALRTGAPLLPTAVYFDGRRHHVVIKPPVDTSRQGRIRSDVERVTNAVATELESLIRLAPEQWHLMQPNWPSDRA